MSGPQPTLHTARLRLRPFEATDAPVVQRLAGNRAIYATTVNIPHPYEDGMAESWIEGLATRWEKGLEVAFALTRIPAFDVVGTVGLLLDPKSPVGELGYWIGKPYWGSGYATEATECLLAYAFGELGLHRVMARHFKRNPASGRVMQKCGMRREGELREHFLKDGVYEDMVLYGILDREWEAR